MGVRWIERERENVRTAVAILRRGKTSDLIQLPREENQSLQSKWNQFKCISKHHPNGFVEKSTYKVDLISRISMWLPYDPAKGRK